MAKAVWVGINNVSRKVNNIYVGVDGVARKVKAAWIGDSSGKARQFWPGITGTASSTAIIGNINTSGSGNTYGGGAAVCALDANTLFAAWIDNNNNNAYLRGRVIKINDVGQITLGSISAFFGFGTTINYGIVTCCALSSTLAVVAWGGMFSENIPIRLKPIYVSGTSFAAGALTNPHGTTTYNLGENSPFKLQKVNSNTCALFHSLDSEEGYSECYCYNFTSANPPVLIDSTAEGTLNNNQGGAVYGTNRTFRAVPYYNNGRWELILGTVTSTSSSLSTSTATTYPDNVAPSPTLDDTCSFACNIGTTYGFRIAQAGSRYQCFNLNSSTVQALGNISNFGGLTSYTGAIENITGYYYLCVGNYNKYPHIAMLKTTSTGSAISSVKSANMANYCWSDDMAARSNLCILSSTRAAVIYCARDNNVYLQILKLDTANETFSTETIYV